MSESSGPPLRSILSGALRRLWLIVLLPAAAGGGAYVYCTRATPEYRSRVTVVFKQPVEKSPIFRESSEHGLEVFVKAQQQIALSELVLARTLAISEDPGLRERWQGLRSRWQRSRQSGAIDDGIGSEAAGTGQEVVLSEIERFLNGGGRDNEVADRVTELMRSRPEAIRSLQDDVRFVTPPGGSSALTESFDIVVDRPAPAGASDGHLQAAYAADTLADMYIVRFGEFQRSLSGAAEQFMNRVVAQHTRAVGQAQQRFDEFVASELSEAGDVAMLEQLLRVGTEQGYVVVTTKARETSLDLREQLGRLKSARQVLRERIPPAAMEDHGVENLRPSEIAAAVDLAPADVARENPNVDKLAQELLRLKAKEANLASQLTPANRTMRDLAEEIGLVRRALLGELVAHARSLDARIAALDQRLAENEAELKSMETRFDNINRKLAQYQRLKNELSMAQQQLQEAKREQMEAVAADQRTRTALTIQKLDAASRPAAGQPVFPRTPWFVGLAAVGGLLVALLFSATSDRYDRSLRSIEESERYLGLPVLGSISKSGRSILQAT